METPKACACHECMQLRQRKKDRYGPTGWFDIFAVAAFVILGTAYFTT